MASSEISGLRYAGFWPRFGSLVADVFIVSPVIVLEFWGQSQFRLFSLCFLIPHVLFFLFYHVYLVRRYGGTPGKLLMGIQIRKVDGSAVTYREAALRYLPQFLLGLVMSVILINTLFQITDAEYQAFSITERYKRQIELAPYWYEYLELAQRIWIWGELLFLLTNRKRRALHDFVAGTVVVYS